ncbi:MAG: response regulator [bacterium]
MGQVKSLLIVDDSIDDQRLISLLFKRSLNTTCFCSFIITLASTLTEAREHLSKTKFDIITLDGMIPELIGGGHGYLLIPDIQKTQSPESVIIMICGIRDDATEGKIRGAHYAFDKSILAQSVKFNAHFELEPLRVSVPNV